MRIFYFVLLFGGFLFSGSTIMASEEGFWIDRISVGAKWQQAGDCNSTLDFVANGSWPLLESEIDLKLSLPKSESYFSSCNLDLFFPNISKNLKIISDYQWNLNYQSVLSGFSYQLRPSKSWTFTCGYGGGRREPVPGYVSNYYYSQNNQQVGFTFHPNHFSYNLDYTYNDKNYPEAEWYTSRRQTLIQQISWRPNGLFDYNLGYQEATGDYPYDLSYTRSFWKATWVLTGEQNLSGRFYWRWDCKQMMWYQGYRSKRSDNSLRMSFRRQINPSAVFQTDFFIAEKIYQDTINYDPDETENPEEEIESRCEHKLIFEYRQTYKKASLGLGVYMASLDYYTAPDVFKFGFFGFWTFKSEYWQLTLKAAPAGSLASNTGYYQLKFDYSLK